MDKYIYTYFSDFSVLETEICLVTLIISPSPIAHTVGKTIRQQIKHSLMVAVERLAGHNAVS